MTGAGVDAGKYIWSSEVWGGIRLASVNEDCRLTKWDLLPLLDGDATGTTFLLHRIPVPGTYAITYLGRRYGHVQLAETSPTQLVMFPRMREGRRRGRVLDETSQPLANVLLVVVATAADLRNVKLRTEQLETITSSSDTYRQLKSIRCGITEYTYTDAAGEFSLSRNNSIPLSERPTIIAVAPGRIAAMHYESTTECQVPYTKDVEVIDVRLPRKAYATGTVLSPTVIPDENNAGQNIPLPSSTGNYYVFHRSTHAWFEQKIVGQNYWQYNDEPTHAVFGQPFTSVVPAGTSFYLQASAEDYRLSNYLWPSKGLVEPSTKLDLGTVSLRPLNPILLKVEYADGNPAVSVYVAQAGVSAKKKSDGSPDQSITDEKGTIVLYTDNGKLGALTLYNQFRRGVSQQFPSQRVDISTSSMPTVLLKLDPKIWSLQGKSPSGFSGT